MANKMKQKHPSSRLPFLSTFLTLKGMNREFEISFRKGILRKSSTIPLLLKKPTLLQYLC